MPGYCDIHPTDRRPRPALVSLATRSVSGLDLLHHPDIDRVITHPANTYLHHMADAP
jgi:hypothetical protein